MNRLATVGLCVLVWLAAAPAAMSADLKIADFVGHYAGTGIANSKDAVTLGLVNRDFDVVIEKANDGFAVAWTTVVRQGVGQDEKQEVKRSSAKIEFKATASPRVFKAPAHNDPSGDQGYAWANIEGRTLTVYIMVVDAKTGAYDLHSYARTLTESNEMALKFTRISTGRPRVIVEGMLKRMAG